MPIMSNEFVDQRSSFLEKCQMYHWQFDEEVNAAHSTLMLLYYLHGMHRTAAAARQKAAAADLAARGLGGAGASSEQQQRSRSSKIEMAMQDWTQLLNHANEAAASETWDLPPEELFLRILAQINKSKRDILQEKYNQCRDPSTTAATRSVFIRVLKRCARRLDPDPTRSPDATPTRTATRRPPARTPARARTRPRRVPPPPPQDRRVVYVVPAQHAGQPAAAERLSPRRREIRPRDDGTVGDGTRVVGRVWSSGPRAKYRVCPSRHKYRRAYMFGYVESHGRSRPLTAAHGCSRPPMATHGHSRPHARKS